MRCSGTTTSCSRETSSPRNCCEPTWSTSARRKWTRCGCGRIRTSSRCTTTCEVQPLRSALQGSPTSQIRVQIQIRFSSRRLMVSLRHLATFFLLCGAVCVAQLSTAPIPMNAATEAGLAKDIPTLMEKAGVPGLSIAVIRDGKTAWTESFGVRNAETKKPVENDTMFNVGSLSKPVFAYGVLKLVDAGKLKLDEPLAPYLPREMTEGDPRFLQITARLVLSHRTGFPNWPGDGKPLTIHFTPGERFSYSGSGMVLLQKAVEKITGKLLNDYMQEAVFAPLGMKHSSYVWNPAFENEVAIGHDVSGAPVDLFKADQANAAASLETTAEDYAMFLDAV